MSKGQTGHKDLIVLVADGQMAAAVGALLARGRSLRCRQISFDVAVHPQRDPGCLRGAHSILQAFSRQYSYALVMLDREGCGRQQQPREQLEAEIEERLAAYGWKDRSAAIVLDPELEIWVWSNSPEVDRLLGWSGRRPSLAEWLKAEGYLTPGMIKPRDPKRAMEEALYLARKSRSASIYRQLAERVSVERCIDPAFLKFKERLRAWFGQEEPG